MRITPIGYVSTTTLEDADLDFHENEYKRLRAELQSPSEATWAGLSDLLIRVRLKQGKERFGAVSRIIPKPNHLCRLFRCLTGNQKDVYSFQSL